MRESVNKTGTRYIFVVVVSFCVSEILLVARALYDDG
jgi:hypothetical protein